MRLNHILPPVKLALQRLLSPLAMPHSLGRAFLYRLHVLCSTRLRWGTPGRFRHTSHLQAIVKSSSDRYNISLELLARCLYCQPLIWIMFKTFALDIDPIDDGIDPFCRLSLFGTDTFIPAHSGIAKGVPSESVDRLQSPKPNERKLMTSYVNVQR